MSNQQNPNPNPQDQQPSPKAARKPATAEQAIKAFDLAKAVVDSLADGDNKNAGSRRLAQSRAYVLRSIQGAEKKEDE